jgi:hypothetical protein
MATLMEVLRTILLSAEILVIVGFLGNISSVFLEVGRKKMARLHIPVEG